MRYKIIYADPPWKYNSTSSPNQIDKYKTTKAKHYYPLMTFDEIKNLRINDIADDDCFLFLWVTFPLIDKCLEVFKAWGFTYKTIGFNWIKLNKNNNKVWFGIGYYTKSNSEVCLLGIKGKPKVMSNKISSVVITHRNNHSSKPNEVRKRIVELCGDLPRIELFARDKVHGWDAWGNDKNLQVKPLEVFNERQ